MDIKKAISYAQDQLAITMPRNKALSVLGGVGQGVYSGLMFQSVEVGVAAAVLSVPALLVSSRVIERKVMSLRHPGVDPDRIIDGQTTDIEIS